jgi:predicted phage terminase large subunit-like protein
MAIDIEVLQADSVVDDAALVTIGREENFYKFVKAAWPTVVPGEPFQENWHVEAICDHLQALCAREFEALLINIPPRHGKSVLCCVMYPAWILAKDPAFRMIFASYSQTFAMRDSRETHRLIVSDWYQRQWGSKFRLAEDADAQVRFETDKKGFRIATSIGGLGTGEGGDLIGVDDPHKADEVASDVQRQTVLDWWNVTMQSRTGRLGRTLRLIVMQRLHETDLSGDVIERGGYTHLCLPQEYEPVKTKLPTRAGWRDPRTEDKALLWPERWSREKIQATQKPPRLSTVVYAGQYQQNPAPAEGGMFLRKWWKYYKISPEALLAKAEDKCWSWDFAFKDLKSSDYVAGTAWVRIGADLYLLPHTVHDKLGYSASRAAVKSCSAMWPAIHAKLVEDKANGTAVVEDLQHTVPGLIAVEPRGGKESRASVMQPYCEAGNVWLPDPSIAGWVEQYVEEFRVFPNGRNDDWVDSSSQAVTWLLDRMLRGFAPFTKSFNRSTSAQHVGEVFRDPRYGDAPVVVPRRSDRGDERASDKRLHDVDNIEHRSVCRACRVTWKKPSATRVRSDMKTMEVFSE